MEDFKSPEACMEGGLQDACEDACSICLEPFSGDDPATVTTCKHEYHLQCILEWSQRSKECPICWQSLALKDPVSQELLVAVENERNSRTRHRSSNASMLPRIPIEDFEFHHVPSYADDSDFDERIMQHLAAAAMGRAHHYRRGRHRAFGQGHSQFLVFATPSSEPDEDQMHATPLTEIQGSGDPTSPEVGTPAAVVSPDDVGQLQASVPLSHVSTGSNSTVHSTDNMHGPFSPRILPGQTPSDSSRRSRPSEFLSFSESLKSKWSAASSRYKESISKSTRGFKEKILARNNSVKQLSKEVQREVTAGIAGVTRIMERLDPTSKRSGAFGSVSSGIGGTSDNSPNRDDVHENLITQSPKSSDGRRALGASSHVLTNPSSTPASPGLGGISCLQELDNSDSGDLVVERTTAVSSSRHEDRHSLL